MGNETPPMYVVRNCSRDVPARRVESSDNLTFEYIHADLLSIRSNYWLTQHADLALLVEYPESRLFGWPKRTTEVAELLVDLELFPADDLPLVQDYEFRTTDLYDDVKRSEYMLLPGEAPGDYLKGMESAALFALRLLRLGNKRRNTQHTPVDLYNSVMSILQRMIAPLDLGKHRDLLIAINFRKGLREAPERPDQCMDNVTVPFDREGHISDVLLDVIRPYGGERRNEDTPCSRVNDFARRLDLPRSDFLFAKESVAHLRRRQISQQVSELDVRYLRNQMNHGVGCDVVYLSNHYALFDLPSGHLDKSKLSRIIDDYVKHWTNPVERIKSTQNVTCGKDDMNSERHNLSSSTEGSDKTALSDSIISTGQDKKFGRTRYKDGPTASTPAEACTQPRELVLMGPVNENGKCRVSVDGTVHELIDSMMTKILAIAIAKLGAKDGEFPGIRADKENSLGFKLYKKLGVTDIRRIVMEARKGLCGLDRDASTDRTSYKKDVVFERKPSDAVRVPGQALPCGYEIAWSAKEINITPLLDYLNNSDLAISPVFGELVSLYKKRK